MPPFVPVPSLYPSLPGKIWQVARGGLSVPAKQRLIREIQASDLVISSGGGYFYSYRQSLPGPMFFQNFLSIWAATACRKPVVLFPQSFGPLFSPPAGRMLKRLLENGSVLKIFAREPKSLTILRKLLEGAARDKTELCPDMAFHLTKDHARSPKNWRLDLPRPILALTVRQWDFPEEKSGRDRQEKWRRYRSVLDEACLEFHRKWKGSIVIVPQARGPGVFEDDRRDSQDLWRRLRRLVPKPFLVYLDLPPVLSPLDMIDIFRQADLILATRFHSAILGLALGVPVISIAYQTKSASSLEWLHLDEWSLPMNELSSQRILELVERIFLERDDLEEKIGAQMSRARAMIEARVGGFLNSFQEPRKS